MAEKSETSGTTMTVWIPRAELRVIDAEAKRLGVSRSDLVRTLVPAVRVSRASPVRQDEGQ